MLVAGAAAWLALLLIAAPWRANAGVLRYCDPPTALDAAQQDRLLRFAAIVKSELDDSNHALALIARSGLDLGRFGQRLSHAGISLKTNANGPWSVRQLYYDCEHARPRLFDQGIAGFLLGGADPAVSHLSLVLLPAAAEAPLAQLAQDKAQALRLLGSAYSANAYPFAQRYQNCNQWVVEMLALAWGGAQVDAAEGPAEGAELRARAQRWLWTQDYQPTRFDVDNPTLMWLAGVLPWLHVDDHPQADLAQQRLRVSMPESIEAFVRRQVPGARRIAFCHRDRQVVVHQGWAPIDEDCRPGAHDRVVALD